MNRKKNNLIADFALETRFDVIPLPAVPFRGTMESELERLKNRLLRMSLKETLNPGYYAPIRQAANEAAALAWMTPFPLLVMPALFEEKAAEARARALRQERIRVRTRPLLVEAA